MKRDATHITPLISKLRCFDRFCFDRIQSGYKMAQRDSLQTTRRLIRQQLEWYEKEGGSVSQEKAIQLKQALQQLEEKYKLMNRK
ncbi:hypothetical protein DW071_14875 [Bacteroides ovatus]|jgi:hypothetical protein|nr:hypothetical protein DW071_14875 [Bacteroides ovatus]